MTRVRAGASIVGTYPLDEAGLREYEAWLSSKRRERSDHA
jgi:hypothetical protein